MGLIQSYRIYVNIHYCIDLTHQNKDLGIITDFEDTLADMNVKSKI